MSDTSTYPVMMGANLLRNAGVVITSTDLPAGSAAEAAVFNSRLYDDDCVLPWVDFGMDLDSGARWIKVDQGVSGTQPVGAWGLAPGHTLRGLTVDIQSSPDASVWTTRDTFTIPDFDAVGRVFVVGEITARYWRIRIATPLELIRVSEWLLSRAILFPRLPSQSGRHQNELPVMTRAESMGASQWAVVNGVPTWQVAYQITDFTDTDRDVLLALYRDLEGGLHNLILIDDESVARYVEWVNPALAMVTVMGQSLHSTMITFRSVVSESAYQYTRIPSFSDQAILQEAFDKVRVLTIPGETQASSENILAERLTPIPPETQFTDETLGRVVAPAPMIDTQGTAEVLTSPSMGSYRPSSPIVDPLGDLREA